MSFSLLVGMGRLGRVLAGALEAKASGSLVVVPHRHSWKTLPHLSPPRQVWLAVGDDHTPLALAELSARWGDQPLDVISSSGSLTWATVAPLCGPSWRLAKCHPLQAFMETPQQGFPPNTPFALGGDRDLCQELIPWLRQWGGEIMILRDEDWRDYHLAAVMAANFLPLFIRLGVNRLTHLTGSSAQAVQWLRPLIGHTVSQALTPEIEFPFSGPVARNDEELMARQCERLAEKDPLEAELYRVCAHLIRKQRRPTPKAQSSGSLD